MLCEVFDYVMSEKDANILDPSDPLGSEIDKAPGAECAKGQKNEEIQSNTEQSQLEKIDDHENSADEDTDTASETESVDHTIDDDPVLSPHKNDLSISPKKMFKSNQEQQQVIPTHEMGIAQKYDYHEVQEYLGLSPIKNPFFPRSSQKYCNQIRHETSIMIREEDFLEIFDDRGGPPNVDAESPNNSDGHQSNIDVDPVISPHKIFHPKFAEQFNFMKKEKEQKSQGVQVDIDYKAKNELISLRAEVKTLRKENEALRETIANKVEEPEHKTSRFEGENEFSWSKKLNFHTKLTQEQCSTLYDSLDKKAREVLLTVVSEPTLK